MSQRQHATTHFGASLFTIDVYLQL